MGCCPARSGLPGRARMERKKELHTQSMSLCASNSCPPQARVTSVSVSVEQRSCMMEKNELWWSFHLSRNSSPLMVEAWSSRGSSKVAAATSGTRRVVVVVERASQDGGQTGSVLCTRTSTESGEEGEGKRGRETRSRLPSFFRPSY